MVFEHMCQWALYQRALKETEKTEEKKDHHAPKMLQAGDRLTELLSFKHARPFMRNDGSRDGAVDPEGRASENTEGNSQALKSTAVYPFGFQIAQNQ